MVVSTFPIEMAESKLSGTVISRSKPHEAMRQRVVAFLVHVVMTYNIRFIGKTLHKYSNKLIFSTSVLP